MAPKHQSALPPQAKKPRKPRLTPAPKPEETSNLPKEGLHWRHVEVLRLEVKAELQLPAYATATPDPSAPVIYTTVDRNAGSLTY